MTGNLVDEIARHVPDPLQGTLGVAVSGGSDSLALLYGLYELKKQRSIDLYAVTIDHRLRPEAADEAQLVAAYCKRLRIPHDIIEWQGWDGQGNLQDAARRARYSLMAEWAQARGIGHIALGHTEDDQAETVLMRLARGAGVDGLSAMAVQRHSQDICWLRPCLRLSRNDLRQFLVSRDITWADDPSNSDRKFDRIKMREALDVLATLGVERSALAQVAGHMQSARHALTQQTLAVSEQIITLRYGALCIDWPSFIAQTPEISRRIILACLEWVAGAEYPPRGAALSTTIKRLETEPAATLDGCLLSRKGNNLWISRELNAIKDQRVDPDEIWDTRWQLVGGQAPRGSYVRALGTSGLAFYPNWRDLGVPRHALAATPALWHGENLIAAPLVNSSSPWQAVRQPGRSALFDALFAH